MKIDVLGKDGYIVTNHERDLANKSLLKITRIFKDNITSDIVVYIKKGKNHYKIEVSLTVFNNLFRSEEEDKNIITAFKLSVDKLYSQILRGKEKIKNRFARRGQSPFSENFVNETQDSTNEKIVKVKKLVLTPIDLNEAILELEQLGHSFYVFKDETTQQVSILYKRNDGGYGLIETQ